MFNNRYKDRKPEETIKILKNFFQSKGYDPLKIVYYNNTESEIYSCAIDLYFKGKFIIHSNGKGTSKELSLASGLAELYERFCTRNNFTSYFQNKILMEQNNLKFNYNFHKNEKFLSYDDIIKIPFVNNFLNSFFNNNENFKKRYLNIICNNKIIGVPYKNLLNEDNIIYIDPRIVRIVNQSTGCSAGNSIEEALNQGISEYFERYVADKFYKEEQSIYYCIPNKNIENLKLKKIIKEIEKKYKLFIFDLSYNFNIPVVLTILVEKENFNILINFGSFPDFDIALERCLTETYQGLQIDGIIDESFLHKNLISFDNYEWYNWFFNRISNYKDIPSFPENLFFKIKNVNTYSNIFVKNKSNKELNAYYKIMAEKNNMDFYFLDYSLNEYMSAIQIFDKNEIAQSANYAISEKFNTVLKQNILEHLEHKNDIIERIINDNINYNLILSESELGFHHTIINITNFDNYLGTLVNGEWFNPYFDFTNFIYYLIDFLAHQDIDSFLSYIYKNIEFIKSSFFYPYLKKLTLLFNYYNYIKDNNENFTFIKTLIPELTHDDINNLFDFKYLVLNYFIKPIQNEINSDFYRELIDTYTLN